MTDTDTVPPAPTSRRSGAATPADLHRVFALAEMVTWTLLVLGMVLKYTGVTEWGVRVGGLVHGVVFLGYAAVTVLVAWNQCWRPLTTLLGLLSAVVPWAAWPHDRMLLRRGLLDGGWRHERGEGRLEGLRLAVLARPGLTALVVVVLVAVATAVLLWLGPPTGWAERFS
ncbi:DUF3817 domain-containing protein [Desertihabitans aurantiacus]|uniref:DUF3817 domain-containing protein n=1 Tax=Desertihabitans aurantiacus TaxID=2282477 RepID=UPI0018E543D1|nr:DUF3817 domain-containing protein [Desertihabitans aurantiacus]